MRNRGLRNSETAKQGVPKPKQGSECTFPSCSGLGWSPDAGSGSGASTQLVFNGCAEAVIAQRVLALQVEANGSGFVGMDGLQHEASVDLRPRIGSGDGGIARMWLYQEVGLAESVAAMTGPREVRWIGDHAGADRVEFDVAVAAQQIGFILHRARFVAAFPQRAGPSIVIVDVAHVAATERLHQRRRRARVLAGQQQMHMVGHQHIGMHGDAELERQLPQVLQIARPVDVGEEARLPIIAPLHDVLGNTGKIQSGLAWHGRSFALRFGQRHPSAAPVRSGDDPSPGRKSAL